MGPAGIEPFPGAGPVLGIPLPVTSTVFVAGGSSRPHRPYILSTDLKVSAAAAVVVPALALLYVLDQRSLLPEEGARA